jgi:GNAT superfamily N-acetyltransferase
MELRLADKKDLNAVYALFLATRAQMEKEGNFTWSGDYPLKRDFAKDIANQQAYVHDENGQIIAYIAVSFDPLEDFFWKTKSPQKALQLAQDVGLKAGESYLLLHRLMVHPSYQGHRLAEGVFQALSSFYPNAVLVFAVFPENLKALNAYLRYGFTNAGIYPAFEYGGDPFYLVYKHPDTPWGSVAKKDTAH